MKQGLVMMKMETKQVSQMQEEIQQVTVMTS
jgi:hypothetical protein